jgi:hypothetical protein
METFAPEMKDLLLQRLEQKLNEGRLVGIYQLGTHYTPEQILDEARRGTPIGEEFLMAEKKFMDEMKRRL